MTIDRDASRTPDGTAIGAVGISGGLSGQGLECCRAGLDALDG